MINQKSTECTVRANMWEVSISDSRHYWLVDFKVGWAQTQVGGAKMELRMTKGVQLHYRRSGMIRCLVCIALITLVGPYGNALGAEKYPTRSVDLIVPFTAGAATDMVTRFMAEELTKKWKQPVNVINKPGGNTVIATQFVMSAVPDGYTLLADATPSSSAQLGIKGLPYEVLNRTFLGGLFLIPMVITVSADSPWKNLHELAEAGRKNPASMIWGAVAGGYGGSDVVVLQFFEAAGIEVPKTRKVDFPGAGAGLNALAGGHIKLIVGSPASTLPLVSGGKARVLAVSTSKRSHLQPEVPTTREAGFPAVNYTFWVGFSGPPGLPLDVREVFSKATEEILKDPDAIERLKQRLDGQVNFLNPEEFKKFVVEESEMVAKLVRLLRAK